MSSDTELQQLYIYVGTQAKLDEARREGLIGENDFSVATDAADLYNIDGGVANSVYSPGQRLDGGHA